MKKHTLSELKTMFKGKGGGPAYATAKSLNVILVKY
jgi:hypothetical protein